MSIAEISKQLGMYPSNIHRILSTLKYCGYVEQILDTQKYCLGLKRARYAGNEQQRLKGKNIVYLKNLLPGQDVLLK